MTTCKPIHKPHIFTYKGAPHIEVIPVKSLFRSNLVHEVVTRGDKFVVNLETGELTIITSRFNAIIGEKL